MSERWGALVAGLLLAILGCPAPPGDDGGLDADPIFPADVETAFTEARECRTSIDHDLRHFKVFTDALAQGPYANRDAPFPEGATVVKVEYADEGCTDVVGYTAMKKLAEGSDSNALDWHWQQTEADRRVLEDGSVQRCYTCHRTCEAPEGWEHTCAVP